MPRSDLAQLDLSPRHLALLRDILARHVPEAEVWAYGSRVLGTAHEGSDLDLVLRHPDDLGKDVANWPALQAPASPPVPMVRNMPWPAWAWLSIRPGSTALRWALMVWRGV